jgi:hypothetical protein
MKFSIRDLLLATVIVALVLGWWVERSRLQWENKVLIRDNALLKVQWSDEKNAHAAASAMYRGFQEQNTELADEIRRLRLNARMPSPSAPAPNLPKP